MNIEEVSQVSNRSSEKELMIACGVFSIAVLLFFPFFAWFGYSNNGRIGLSAAAVAGGICWIAGIAALIVTSLLRGPEKGVQGTLLAMVFRMGLPLGTGIFLSRPGNPLGEAGVFSMIVAFYLLTLVVETLLAVRLIRPSTKTSEVA